MKKSNKLINNNNLLLIIKYADVVSFLNAIILQQYKFQSMLVPDPLTWLFQVKTNCSVQTTQPRLIFFLFLTNLI